MSTGARDVITTALVIEWSETGVSPTREQMAPSADAVIAALEAAGLTIVPRADEWEWGVRWLDGTVGVRSGYHHAAETVRDYPNYSNGIVRRRPHGAWEVAL